MWFIIVNPAAGGGKVRRLWPRLERELQAQGFSYSVKFTERKMHAIELVEDAILRGHRKFMAIGGDGTVHEVANGILAQAFVPSCEIGLALVPVGTGNDWAKQWGLSASPVECLKKIKLENVQFQDAGRAHFFKNGEAAERFFINVAGMAYDAFVVRESERQTADKGSFGGYYGLIIKCLWKYELTPARLFFVEPARQTGGNEAKPTPEILVEDSFYTINIGLCKYSGGGMQFVPQAVPDDGLFALTFVRRLPKMGVILATPLFYNGKIGGHPKVTCTQARELRVENVAGQPSVLLEADGEFLGETPVRFEILPGALKVFC